MNSCFLFSSSLNSLLTTSLPPLTHPACWEILHPGKAPPLQPDQPTFLKGPESIVLTVQSHGPWVGRTLSTQFFDCQAQARVGTRTSPEGLGVRFLLSNLALLFHPIQVTRTFADSKVGFGDLGVAPSQSVLQDVWINSGFVAFKPFYMNEN